MARRILSVLSILLLPTCGGAGGDEGLNEANARTKWAEQLCEQAAECGCEAGTDVDACIDENKDFFASWQKVSQQQYLDFDVECMQSWLDLQAGNECESTPTDLACDVASCSFWVGGVAEGMDCELDPAPFATHCEQGLRCYDGTCRDPCTYELPKASEGETCASQQALTAVCVDGLFCDIASTHQCVPDVQVGDPCVAGQCGTGKYCADDDTCAARNPEGDACTEDIQCSTFACVGEVCGPREAWVCGYAL